MSGPKVPVLTLPIEPSHVHELTEAVTIGSSSGAPIHIYVETGETVHAFWVDPFDDDYGSVRLERVHP